jgi:hypothetical protein
MTYNSAFTSYDVHNDSHFAPLSTVAANADWHSSMYGRLITNLQNMKDAGGSLLDNSVVTLFFSEGPSAHSKTNMRFVIAGLPSKLKMGQYMASAGHPATVYISAMQALGANFSKLGEVSGAYSAILK